MEDIIRITPTMIMAIIMDQTTVIQNTIMAIVLPGVVTAIAQALKPGVQRLLLLTGQHTGLPAAVRAMQPPAGQVQAATRYQLPGETAQ
jgi:homoaconitase/3-isopropylmalate dehydratase large subunit